MMLDLFCIFFFFFGETDYFVVGSSIRNIFFSYGFP